MAKTKAKAKTTIFSKEQIRRAVSKAIGDLIMEQDPDMIGQNMILEGAKQHILSTRKSRLAKLESEKNNIGASL
jgi:hypothetical protein